MNNTSFVLIGLAALGCVFTVPFLAGLPLAAPPLWLGLVVFLGVCLLAGLSRRSRRRGAAMLMTVLTLLCFGVATPAEAQFTPARYRVWTNVPSLVTTLAISNINANAFTLQRDKGVGCMILFGGSNAATANLAIEFEVTKDGVNWSTTAPFRFLSAANGTTAVLDWTNLCSGDPVRLNNIAQIRPKRATNAHTASLFISNIWWTYNSD